MSGFAALLDFGEMSDLSFQGWVKAVIDQATLT
jgi:hypothetical protein